LKSFNVLKSLNVGSPLVVERSRNARGDPKDRGVQKVIKENLNLKTENKFQDDTPGLID